MNVVLNLPPDIVAGLAAEVAKQIQAQPVGWLNVDGAATYLSTTPDAIRSLVKRGAIPTHRAGGRVLFSPAELDAYVRGQAA